MGISPYYRGTDCNFWAMYDNNPHLVGSTIHLLTKGLDSGPILYHALSKLKLPTHLSIQCPQNQPFIPTKKKLMDKSIFTLYSAYSRYKKRNKIYKKN